VTKERYHELMSNADLQLTKEELKAGWRFCNDYDGLLVNKDQPPCNECGYAEGCNKDLTGLGKPTQNPECSPPPSGVISSMTAYYDN